MQCFDKLMRSISQWTFKDSTVHKHSVCQNQITKTFIKVTFMLFYITFMCLETMAVKTVLTSSTGG